MREAPGGTPPAPGGWAGLLGRDAAAWERARADAQGPRVLFATSMGGFVLGSLVESALAAALTLRGARVEFLLCDSALPGCQQTEIGNTTPAQVREAPPLPRCQKCERVGGEILDPLGLVVHRYGDELEPRDREEAARLAAAVPLAEVGAFRHDGLAVGEHARAGALRYFARGDFEGEPEAPLVVRRFLEAALLTACATRRLIARRGIEIACFHHGIYVPQGLIGEVCRSMGVRVVNWNPSYRRGTFVFSHHDSYHRTMISEPVATWEDRPWGPETERATMAYLASRRRGTEDWIWFHETPEEDARAIERACGVDFSRPCIALLTSVVWDAQLHYASNAFPDMTSWVLRTIEWFAGRPDLQLVVRVHPAEIHGGVPSRQRMADEIARRFAALPPNVFVLGPESSASTYTIVDRCNAALIYNTKTGIEVSAQGIPVIVAGEAWVRGKGFTLDARSAAEYFELLGRLPLPGRLPAAQVLRARRYAHHFFFRRMIRLPFVAQDPKGRFVLGVEGLQRLAPGATPEIDAVCAGILEGTPFVFEPAPREGVAHGA